MFGQIANERDLPGCPIVADVGGKLTCDVTEMKDFIAKVSKYKLSCPISCSFLLIYLFKYSLWISDLNFIYWHIVLGSPINFVSIEHFITNQI